MRQIFGNKIKSIIIVFIFVLSVTSLTLFVIQIKNKLLNQSKQAVPTLISEAKPGKINPAQIVSLRGSEVAEAIHKIEQYVKEFNMPAELKEELVEAGTKGAIDTRWGKDEISKKEIDEAGLSLNKLAKQKPDSETANISAGYIVNSAKFEKLLAACNPSKDDSQQTKELKKQALEELGFSALSDDNKKQINEIISQIESSEMPRVPMIDLEYALSLIDDGRKDEAYKIINEDISQNQNDKEFVEIAGLLLEEMNKNE